MCCGLAIVHFHTVAHGNTVRQILLYVHLAYKEKEVRCRGASKVQGLPGQPSRTLSQSKKGNLAPCEGPGFNPRSGKKQPPPKKNKNRGK